MPGSEDDAQHTARISVQRQGLEHGEQLALHVAEVRLHDGRDPVVVVIQLGSRGGAGLGDLKLADEVGVRSLQNP